MLHAFATVPPDGDEQSATRYYFFTAGVKSPMYCWLGGWMGPRIGLDAVLKRKFTAPAVN